MSIESNDDVPGHHWYANGQSAYSGAALRLFKRLDLQFLTWASVFDATEYMFPTFAPVAELQKLDYLRSFQHLVTFPTALDPDEANLKRFAAGDPVGPDGAVRMTTTSPIRDVLTPAACYHLYMLFQNSEIEPARYLTTRNTCFRREAQYVSLERQWSFSMRELVCIGTSDAVTQFLDRCRGLVEAFLAQIDLHVDWTTATDPFFNPLRNPKFFAQKAEPLKTEMIFDGHLAIGSVNFHRTYFGEAFEMTTAGDEPAYSGCVAFGLDRWVHAFVKRFGPDESRWPLPPAP